MKPLQSVAMGLVIVGLTAELGGYDALADPAGWLLVLLGVRDLPRDVPRRRAVLALAALAGAVSVPLWLPGVAEALDRTHPSLLWASNLPQLGFCALLCHSLAGQAGAAGDRKPSDWLRIAAAGFVVAAALPVLVFGGGLRSLEIPAYVAAACVLLLLVWLLFSYASRPWAGSPAPGRPRTPRGSR